MPKFPSRWKWRMKARWRENNKHVIWVLLLSLLALITSFSSFSWQSLNSFGCIWLAAFSTLLSIDCSLLSTVFLVWAVYLWNKTGPEYCRRSSESLESSCGNARRNCRPLAAEYRDHPAAAMFVFFLSLIPGTSERRQFTWCWDLPSSQLGRS